MEGAHGVGANDERREHLEAAFGHWLGVLAVAVGAAHTVVATLDVVCCGVAARVGVGVVVVVVVVVGIVVVFSTRTCCPGARTSIMRRLRRCWPRRCCPHVEYSESERAGAPQRPLLVDEAQHAPPHACRLIDCSGPHLEPPPRWEGGSADVVAHERGIPAPS